MLAGTRSPIKTIRGARLRVLKFSQNFLKVNDGSPKKTIGTLGLPYVRIFPDMFGILANPIRLSKLAAWIPLNLPQEIQLVAAKQVMTFFFSKNTSFLDK